MNIFTLLLLAILFLEPTYGMSQIRYENSISDDWYALVSENFKNTSNTLKLTNRLNKELTEIRGSEKYKEGDMSACLTAMRYGELITLLAYVQQYVNATGKDKDRFCKKLKAMTQASEPNVRKAVLKLIGEKVDDDSASEDEWD